MSENVQTFSGKVNVADNLLVGTSHFFVDRQNNRVGIGTSTPDASSMLDVTGNIKSGGTITATGGFSGDGSGLSGVNSDSGSWVNGSSSNVHLAVSTDNVGIGTVDPDGPLHLVLPTKSNYAGFTYQSGDVKTVFGNAEGGTNTSFVQVYSGVTTSVPDTNSGTYNLALQPHGGNVGIGGVLQPAEKLDVNGNIKASGLVTVGSYTSAPSSTLNGSIYYNSTTHELNVLANGVWSALSAFTPANITNLVGWYLPDNRSGTTWTDASTAGNDATCTSVNGPVGPSGGLRYLYGGVNSYIQFPSAILPSTYTLFHVAKYNGTAKKRIFDGKGNNWLSGFWDGKSGVAYHVGWLTSQSDRHGSKWVISTDQNSRYRSYSTGTTWYNDTGGGGASTRLGINYGNHAVSGSNSEKSDWAVAEVIVYSRTLSVDEYTLIHNYLKNKYNL